MVAGKVLDEVTPETKGEYILEEIMQVLDSR
jgi:hypothetical protein